MNDITSANPQDLPFGIHQGNSPLVLGIPHAGTCIPDDVRIALNDTGRAISDTDWHMDRVHEGLVDDVTIVSARFHRYVIDANRDPSGASLYPGQNTTGLIPLTDFDGNPIWAQEPGAMDIESRRKQFHAPYHAALAAELARVKALHGFAILYDCHSIRSQIPFLFEGTLPDFNIGTNHGVTCAPALQALVMRHCADANGFTSVLNGRFVGGWTTRHYGQPDQGIHAIQMELAQSTYMQQSPPWAWDKGRATRLRAVLGPMLREIAALDLS
ncbi:N-formylglutamate deformylase [Roseinatronobacter alkalisoli]|uniref:N-formylglutamate deformylase n=1 Tax=Roseinatronobacter alkalisoli TaxID=3028235 RepID=A0ABT5T854_9RHOB|nr:N-formylglutamate deformylase [Roseinatronobacter sp. HJB301]MDD7970880.1 N-formylglutamate deformylase [Roseinatronobacter sp. HJB301]